MAHSSILGVERASPIPRGHDLGALGPSDSSDTGSDVQGLLDLEETGRNLSDLRPSHVVVDDSLHHDLTGTNSDAAATGERASIIEEEDLRDAGDIAPDRIIQSLDEIGSELDFEAADQDEEEVPDEDDQRLFAQGRDAQSRSPLDSEQWVSRDDE